MPPPSRQAFRHHYRRAVDELLPFISRDRLQLIARHNPGWAPDRFDAATYMRASETRYVNALEIAERYSPGCATGRVLDAGGFFGMFPLALARLGARVTLSEKYSYYYGAFDDLRSHLEQNGVEVWDEDLTHPPDREHEDRFDLITIMALLEHLPYSPRALIDTARDLLGETGRLVVEVPNIAYWPKRLAAVRGQSVHPPLRDVYESAEPFTGHHREYTEGELIDVLEWSGLTVDDLCTYNYTPRTGGGTIWRLLNVWPTRLRRFRELLLACASTSS